jgi:hypothetical protein
VDSSKNTDISKLAASVAIRLSDGTQSFNFPVTFDLSAVISLDYFKGGTLVINTDGTLINGFQSSGDLEFAQSIGADRRVEFQLGFNGKQYTRGLLYMAEKNTDQVIEIGYDLIGTLQTPRFDLFFKSGHISKSVRAENMPVSGNFSVTYAVIYTNGTTISSWISVPYDFCVLALTCTNSSFVASGSIEILVDPVKGEIFASFLTGPTGKVGPVIKNSVTIGNTEIITGPARKYFSRPDPEPFPGQKKDDIEGNGFIVMWALIGFTAACIGFYSYAKSSSAWKAFMAARRANVQSIRKYLATWSSKKTSRLPI